MVSGAAGPTGSVYDPGLLDDCGAPATLDRVVASKAYHSSYRTLIEAARLIAEHEGSFPKGKSGEHGAIYALACLAYGWMPTAFRNPLPDAPFGADDRPLMRISNLEGHDQARTFLEKLDASSPPINKSWVGTSKVLHFLNPELFPIFDSNIFRHTGLAFWKLRTHGRVYLTYCDFVWEMARTRNLEAVIARVESEFGYRPSKVRAVELILFTIRPA